MAALLYAHDYTAQQASASADNSVCVLLHGLFGMSSNLLSLVKNLSAECYPIALDLPNHGLSPTLAKCDFISMAEMLDATIEYHIQNLQVHSQTTATKVHLLGHSLGGKLAMVYALLYPEKTYSLLAMDIAPVTYPPFHKDRIIGLKKVLSEKATTRNEAVRILEPFCASLDEARFFAKSFDFNVENAENPVSSKIRIHEIEENYDVLRSFPFDAMQGKLFTKPMLLLHAEETEYFSEGYYEDIEQYFPAWELEEVPNSGHNIHVDNLKCTTDAILNFYRQIS